MQPLRVAMWSGPRNISTAMMRAWEARQDCVVCDEPLYARWLLRTGADHPGRDEVIAQHETDFDAIVHWLTEAPLPQGARIFYQKHMAHHLLAGDDDAWTARLANALLIRAPRAMIASYVKIVPNPTLEDLGFPQLLRLFEQEGERLGRTPPVVDAADVLADPAGILRALCRALGAPYDPAMLSWKPGLRKTDGVWARWWYSNVARSTGFGPPRTEQAEVPARLTGLLRQCERVYEKLRAVRLGAVTKEQGDAAAL